MPRICCKRNGHWTTFLGSEGTENKRPAPTASIAGTYMSVVDIGNTLQCQISNRYKERGERFDGKSKSTGPHTASTSTVGLCVA